MEDRYEGKDCRSCGRGGASLGFSPAAVKNPLGPPRAPGGFTRISTVFYTGRARIAELERLVARQTGELAALEKVLHELSARVERGSTVAIRADLDNLVARVEALATSNRKEFGRLHAANRKEPSADADNGLSGPDGDALAEQIAFQRQWSS